MNNFLEKLKNAGSVAELDEIFGNAQMREISEHHFELLFRAYTLGIDAGVVANESLGHAWIPVAERLPESDNQLVIVKTNTGAKYFGRTINGHFMDNVVAWYPLPN